MGCCGGGGQKSGDSEGGCCGSGESAESKAPFMGSDEKPILFTDAAVAAVKDAISKEGEAGDGLRVSVVGGGCSGYQYSLDFDKESRMGDITIVFDGLTIFIDPVSAGYLKGTVVDYISGLNGTGFKFTNPNAKRTCGCGSSFS